MPEQRQAQRRPHELFGQKQIGLLIALHGDNRGGAVDHDDAQTDQQKRGQEQHLIELEFSSHFRL